MAIKKKIGNNGRLSKSTYHSRMENHRPIQCVLSINRHAFHATFLIPHPKQKYIEQKIELAWNMRKAYIVTVALFALAFSLASASDPDPLQDFCVALKDYSDSKSAGTYFSFSFSSFCNIFVMWRIYTNRNINGRNIISYLALLFSTLNSSAFFLKCP